MLQGIKEYAEEKKIKRRAARGLAWFAYILNFPFVFIIAVLTVLTMQGIALGIKMYHTSDKAFYWR